MTTHEIADSIISDIKAFPDEAKQSRNHGGPKTSWDEYKEQVQYEEYDSFEVMKETISSMVKNELLQLSDEDIDNIGPTIGIPLFNPTGHEKRLSIMDAVKSRIHHLAENEEIEYNRPEIEYIKYVDHGICMVANVKKQVSPDDFVIHVYSEEAGPAGMKEIANLTTLDQECSLERITVGEYRRTIKNIKKTNLTQEQQIYSTK